MSIVDDQDFMDRFGKLVRCWFVLSMLGLLLLILIFMPFSLVVGGNGLLEAAVVIILSAIAVPSIPILAATLSIVGILIIRG